LKAKNFNDFGVLQQKKRENRRKQEINYKRKNY